MVLLREGKNKEVAGSTHKALLSVMEEVANCSYPERKPTVLEQEEKEEEEEVEVQVQEEEQEQEQESQSNTELVSKDWCRSFHTEVIATLVIPSSHFGHRSEFFDTGSFGTQLFYPQDISSQNLLSSGIWNTKVYRHISMKC